MVSMIKTLLGTVVLLALCAACNKPGCAQKAGSTTRTVRNTGAFEQLVINDNINVVLREGPCSVVIETDDALQPVVSAQVRDGQLYLENNASCSFIRRPGESITAYVSLPHLTLLDYHGSGLVTCPDTLHTDYVTVEADHGAGDVHLKLDALFTLALIDNEVTDFYFEGKSDSCYAWCASRGSIDFRGFQVKRMGLAYAGVRDGYVWATESLHATVFQSGNLYYKGRPLLRADYRSSGRLLVY